MHTNEQLGGTNPPLVSVIIPAYNCAAFVSETIDSILNQDYPNIEIIVNNDGSTDDTRAILDQYRGKIRTTYTARAGAAGARNKALQETRGDWIALLDADDKWLPFKISMQMQFMLEHPKVALCHTATKLFGSQSGDGPILDKVRCRITGSCFKHLLFRNGIVTSSVLLRKSAMPAEGFDHTHFGTEDYKMWLQILTDWNAGYIPQVTTYYRRWEGQTSGPKGVKLQVQGGRARLEVLNQFANRFDADEFQALKSWTLNELEKCSYSRYWNGDYTQAREGFNTLRNNGRKIKWRHRIRAMLPK